jgi:hypothetical protein
MAVPPTQSSKAFAAGPAVLAHAVRAATVQDVVLGILVLMAVPLAVLAIPNTISVVGALLPPDASQLAMIRANGLALPVMVLTVPLAAAVVRRVRVAPLLVGGLVMLAVADAAGGFATSPLLVGALRVLRGIGAGVLLPATLTAVQGRSWPLRAVWVGALVAALLAAQALALWPLADVDAWQVVLQPYPMVTGIALGLAALYLMMSPGAVQVAGGSTSGERGPLLPTLGPAAGIALLALGTSFSWPPTLVLAAALLAVLTLLGLASFAPTEGADGRALAYVMVTVGLVLLPTAAQVTTVEVRGLGGPGLSGIWAPFCVAGVLGVVAAVVVARLPEARAAGLTVAGLVMVVAGLGTVRPLVPTIDGMLLLIPFALLTCGAVIALTASLRVTGPGAAQFALSLFLPSVLTGFLLGGGVQMAMLGTVSTPQMVADGLTGSLRLWALIGGFLVVLVIVLSALLARRGAHAGAVPAARPGSPAAAAISLGDPDDVPSREGPDGPAPEAVPEPRVGDRDDPAARSGTGRKPAVPPPATSPEDVG